MTAGAAATLPAELPLEQVDGFLHRAGVTSAWSVEQWHNDRAPAVWSIEAYAGREKLGDHLCRSEVVELELAEKDGELEIANRSRSTVYAFAPCLYALPEDFHDVRGNVDPMRLQEDFVTIASAIRGDAAVKVSFAESTFRDEFAKLRRNDISGASVEKDGHTRVCFISGLVDELGAIEKLSVDVLPGNQVKVDLCGTIDVTQTKR